MTCSASLVVLFVCVVHSLTLPNGVKLQCPSTYNILTSENEKITINVKEKKEACDNARNESVRKASQNKGTLKISVKPVFKQEYKAYHADIIWIYNVTDGDLPKKFLLSLAFYKGNSNLSSTCLQVRLKGNPKVKKNDKVTFHFDCLPLLNEKDISLVTEVLSLPQTSSPSCRMKRSNPDTDTSCNNGILCSGMYAFPISENMYGYRQCVCHVKNYGNPKLHWSINEQWISISLSNLPPYLEYVQLDIVTVNGSFQTHTFKQNDIQNGNARADLQVDPGRYKVYVCCAKLKIAMSCDDRNAEVSRIEFETSCDYGNPFFFTFSENITVSDGVSLTSVPTPMSLGYILGIVGSIVVIGIVTLVTFLLRRCRNTPSSSTHLPATNGPKCGQIPSIEEIETIELTDVYTPHSDVQNRQPSPNNEQETCVDDRIQALQKQVLLLYHTTNDIEFERVVRLKEFLERVNIYVNCMTGKQLQGFPEAIQDIVLIFPQIPYGQCHYLKHGECSENDPFIDPENFDPVVKELLDKTAKMVLEGPDPPNKGRDEAQYKDGLKHNSINLHLVSFDNEYGNLQDSVQAFLRDYYLTKSKGSAFSYYLLGDDLNLKENSEVLHSLEARIKGSFPDCINQKIREINSSTLEL